MNPKILQHDLVGDVWKVPTTIRKGQDIRMETQERLSLENALDIILFVRADDGHIVGANRAAVEAYGYSLDELQSLALRDLHAPDAYDTIATQLRKAGSKGAYYETTHRCRDGRELILEVRICSMNINDQHLLLHMARDITPQAQAQPDHKPRQRDGLARALFGRAADAIAIVRESRFVDCNPRLLTMFGCTRDQILGQRPIDFSPAQQADGRWSEDAIVEATEIALSGTPVTTEWLHSRIDGSLFPTEVTLNRVDLEGDVYLQASVREVTPRKRVGQNLPRKERDVDVATRELESLMRISAALSGMESQSDILATAAHHLTSILKAAGVAIALRHVDLSVTIAEAQGVWAAERGPYQSRAYGVIDRVLANGNVYRAGCIAARLPVNRPAYSPDFTSRLNAIVCAPLMIDHQIMGALVVGRNRAWEEDDVCMVIATADIVAKALHRAMQPKETRNGGRRMMGILDSRILFEGPPNEGTDLQAANDATLEAWTRALEVRDAEPPGHSQRVTELAERLAFAVGMSGEELEHLRRGALLHDIGKMGIPDSVLRKPGPLDKEEWDLMRRHPEYAYHMLAPIDFLRPALDIPYCHHEKWDGTGYPRKLQGTEIPLSARIFAVADVWDALHSDRPFRPALSDGEAMAYMLEASGSHFDPRVISIFFSLVKGVQTTPFLAQPVYGVL